MEPSTSMCPVLVSLPRLLAAPALHYTSSLFFLILMLVKVIILTTDALKQQHRHQIARSSLKQSVPHLTVDVRCVFDVEDVSLYATFPQVGPLPSCPRVHCSTGLELLMYLVCLLLQAHVCTQVVDTSHGFSVSHDTVMGKCIREQISAFVAVTDSVVL